MKKVSQGKWMWSIVIALSVGIAGCNLFHPTGSNDAESDDPAALTLEGYQEFQKANYDDARKFFNKAIKADSGYSEAWIGLCKSVLSSQQGLDIFELLLLVHDAQESSSSNGDGYSSSSTAKTILNISDEKADTISRGIDSTMYYLDQFIARDTTGKTDKKVRFSDIAESYTILQFTKAALLIKKVEAQLTSTISADGAGMQINLNTLNTLGDNLRPFLSDMAAASEAIKASPESTAEIVKAYMPDSTRNDIGDEFYTDATVGLANKIILLNEKAKSVEDERLDVFFTFGNGIDDDGDGCVDEEIVDNYDNDGDGEIDEDARDNRVVVLAKNQSWQTLTENEDTNEKSNPAKYDMTKGQVDSLIITEKYETIDIDMNNKKAYDDLNEWQFVIRDPNERDEQKDHRFKFAIDLNFPGKNLADKIKNKELIRHDTDKNNIKYSLKDRQKMVGGCWNNYNQEKFLEWFEGRDAK